MEFKNLHPREFKEGSSSDDVVIVDVRTPEEKAEGDIPRSELYNLMDPDFTSRINTLDKSKDYYVFCRSGGRSASVCDYMSNLGFTCYNLDGGIKAWNAEFGLK